MWVARTVRLGSSAIFFPFLSFSRSLPLQSLTLPTSAEGMKKIFHKLKDKAEKEKKEKEAKEEEEGLVEETDEDLFETAPAALKEEAEGLHNGFLFSFFLFSFFFFLFSFFFFFFFVVIVVGGGVNMNYYLILLCNRGLASPSRRRISSTNDKS